MRGWGWLLGLVFAIVGVVLLFEKPDPPRIARRDGPGQDAETWTAGPDGNTAAASTKWKVSKPVAGLFDEEIARLTGIVTGPLGPIWGVKVILRSTDASATKPLGETHTGAEGRYELELVSAGAEAWLVKAAAVPDGNTHLKRVGTDGFKLKPGHTTTLDFDLGSRPRLKGVVLRRDGDPIRDTIHVYAVPLDALQRLERPPPGYGNASARFPPLSGVPSGRIHATGTVSIMVPRETTYRLFCSSGAYLLDCEPVRPGTEFRAQLTPACGIRGVVRDLARHRGMDRQGNGLYLDPLPLQVRFESKSGHAFDGYGQSEKGAIFLKWPRPEWWKRFDEISATIESYGVAGRAGPRSLPIPIATFRGFLALEVIPANQSLRLFAFEVIRGGTAWNGPLEVRFVPEASHGVGAEKGKTCIVVRAAAPGGYRAFVPPGTGKLALLYNSLPMAVHDVDETPTLADYRFELPESGKIRINLPASSPLVGEMASVRRTDDRSGFATTLSIALRESTRISYVAPGDYEVVVEHGGRHEVKVRPGRTAWLELDGR